MKDYINISAKKHPPKTNLYIYKLSMVVGGASFMLLAFIYLVYQLNITHSLIDNNLVNNQPDSVAVEELPQPPQEKKYDFHNILTEEQPVRIDNTAKKTTIIKNFYYILVEGYTSYDAAKEELGSISQWGIHNFKIEPYSRKEELLFRIKIGPFTSRSNMNAKRDILFDNNLPNRSLVLKN